VIADFRFEISDLALGHKNPVPSEIRNQSGLVPEVNSVVIFDYSGLRTFAGKGGNGGPSLIV
jgi:hypothetical protein